MHQKNSRAQHLIDTYDQWGSYVRQLYYNVLLDILSVPQLVLGFKPSIIDKVISRVILFVLLYMQIYVNKEIVKWIGYFIHACKCGSAIFPLG